VGADNPAHKISTPSLPGGRFVFKEVFMAFKPDYKKFQSLMNAHCPDKPVTEAEAAEAFNNLAEFVCTLLEINNRLDLVPVGSSKK
jgi:hypothetical protein